MDFVKKLYFELNFTWPKVVIYAVACGVACGLIMMCHALDGTSIHEFGVSPEGWLFLGLFICTNSKKPLESALKLFVFFLISQPLVYLTMWPEYGRFPWEYYMYWFYWTIACLPMGYLAWYIKKGNVLSVVIVILTCAFMLLFGAGYAKTCLHSFPSHLLGMLFCFAQVPLYIWLFLPEQRQRIIAAAVSVVLAAVFVVGIAFSGPDSSAGYYYEGAGECQFESCDLSIVQVGDVTDDGFALNAKGYGSTILIITDADGNTTECPVTVAENGSIQVEGLGY